MYKIKNLYYNMKYCQLTLQIIITDHFSSLLSGNVVLTSLALTARHYWTPKYQILCR